MCGAGTAVLAAAQQALAQTVFRVTYDSDLRDIVPGVHSFDCGNTTFECERAPNLTLTVACDREEDKVKYMRALWRAFPKLKSRGFQISKVYTP